MTHQFFDRVVYCLMAAVLVVPEPTTFIVCVLISFGVGSYCATRTKALLRLLRSLISSAMNAADRLQPADS